MSKAYYKQILTMYGIIPILTALKLLENLEEYEECAKIEAVLKEIEEYLDIQYPRKVNKELIKEVKDQYKHPEHLTFYINLVLEDIEDYYGSKRKTERNG